MIYRVICRDDLDVGRDYRLVAARTFGSLRDAWAYADTLSPAREARVLLECSRPATADEGSR